MVCKLSNNTVTGTIKMSELPAGKLGVIVRSEFSGGHIGDLVQKGDKIDSGFIILGSKYYHGEYSDSFSSECNVPVRIVKVGELIEVKSMKTCTGIMKRGT